MDGSDASSMFSASANTFLEKDFQLPDLEVNSTGNLEDQKAEQRLLQRIHRIKQEIQGEKNLLRKIDHLDDIPNKEFERRRGIGESETRLKILKSTNEANIELNVVERVLCREPGELEETLNVLEAIAEGTFEGNEDDYAESTIDHPKLGSVEEKMEDLRQSSIERWCALREKVPNQKYSNEEKRKLRRWFRALDYDGSGEVNVEELQDPMLSSGILKTREQVVRVLANVDKNNTMGIDFEEFLLALSANKLADQAKLKRLQQMSSDPFFETDTLLTAERRNKLIKSILRRCFERQEAIDKLYKKYDKPKLSKKEREQFNIEREKLEEEQSRSIYLHLKYVHALELVIHDRKTFYEDQKLRALEENNNVERLTNNKDFYKGISNIRMTCPKREDALQLLESLVPLHPVVNGGGSISAPNSRTYDPNFSRLSVSTQQSFSSLSTPMLGSTYLDSLRPTEKNSVQEFRSNPYKIYAPYSPKIKKLDPIEYRKKK